MNPELLNQALGKITNPNVLVNLVSRRVRQLNAGARPLLGDTGTLGVADIALLEIIEDKIGFEMPEVLKLKRRSAHAGKKPQGWATSPSKSKMAA